MQATRRLAMQGTTLQGLGATAQVILFKLAVPVQTPGAPLQSSQEGRM